MGASVSTARSALTIALVVLLAGCGFFDDDKPKRSEDDNSVVGAGAGSVYELRVGDCIDVPDDIGDAVEKLPLVPCDEPHTHEVSLIDIDELGSFDLYPGAVETEAAASELCWDAFETYVDIPVLESQYTYTYLYPTLQSWQSGPKSPGFDGDRTIVCLVVRQRTTGSVQGAGR